jgi:uncharacterized protein (TIRG00374 family)
VVYYLVGLALGGIAVWEVSGKSAELRGATTYLRHLTWWWVVLAAGAEVVSYLAFAGAMRRLLRSGGVEVPLRTMTVFTVAGNAIQNTLPAGIALGSAYLFRQFRRQGADDVLAGWVIVAVAVLSFGGLTLIAATGVILALGSASALDLVVVIGGLVAVSLLLVAAWLERALWALRVAGLVRLCQRLFRRPRGDPNALVVGWLQHLGAISPSRRDWGAAAAMALGNWLADLGCLTLAFLAIGGGVPWRGLFLAYGAGQLAAILPITPGGLGVVEGSITVALVAFGGAEASAVAAVLVYRLISFWLMLPVGWGSWTVIALSRYWGRRKQTAPARPVGSLAVAVDEP